MLVSTLIESLADGELSQLALADIGTVSARNEQQERNITRLVGFTNQAVQALYSELPIKVDVTFIDVDEPSTYDFPIALPEKALNLVKITLEDGTEIPIDDYDIEYRFKNKVYDGIFAKTVAINTYLVLGNIPSAGVELLFHHTTSPDTLTATSKLPLPSACEEAARLYISYKAYSTTRSVTPTGDEGIVYKKKYDEAVAKLKDKFDLTYEWADPNRLRVKGFV